MATDAYFGNPNIARQGAKARQMAQARSVSNIADPRTYGFMQGLLGTAPDELGYSVFDNPETKQAAQRAAEIGLIGGGLLGSVPIIGSALRSYGRMSAPKNIASQYPQQTALDLAQKRAALPIEQGGLGLPADNTPQMRARAMNYTNEMFHETSGKNIEDGLLGFDVKRVGAAASDEQTPYAMFLKPHGQNIGVVKNQISQMPVLVKSNLTDENILRAFGNREELQNYLNQFPEIKQATQAVRKLDDQMADYIDQISKKADDLYAQGKTAEAEKLLDSTNINSNLMKEFDARTNELAALSKQKITDLFKSQGVGTVGLTNDTGAFGRKTITEMVLNPAENVRSRFAAFDPFRKDVATATAMGVALPDLLAAEPPQQYQPSGLLYPLP